MKYIIEGIAEGGTGKDTPKTLVPTMRRRDNCIRLKETNMTNLLQWGKFILHSGHTSNFRIDCDALTEADWETIANLIVGKFDFYVVHGIPRGGEKLAKMLHKHTNPFSAFVLIVDDVFTTGKSMEEARQKFGVGRSKGVVVFARGKCPYWITPMFQLNRSWQALKEGN